MNVPSYICDFYHKEVSGKLYYLRYEQDRNYYNQLTNSILRYVNMSVYLVNSTPPILI